MFWHRSLLKHKKDLIAISAIYVFCVFFVFLFDIGNYLVNVVLFFGVPALYISVKQPKIIKKSFFFSVLFSFPAVLVLDYMAHVSKAWHESSVIGIRVMDTFPVDTFIWAFLYSYFITVFYKYFFDRGRTKRIFEHNTKKFFYLIGTIVALFSIVLLVNKDLLVWPYFYIILELALFVFPVVAILWHHPKLITKVVLQGAFFFPYSLIYEFVALHYGDWSFAGGKYIGMVRFFEVEFPFEELFWLVMAVPAYICIYEYYDDDLH